MISEWFFGQFLGPLDVEFNINSLHADLLKEHRDAATNLYICHDKIIVLDNKLRLSVIGHIAIVIDSTREKPGTRLLERPPRNQHELELEIIRQNGFKQMHISLNNRCAPPGKDFFLNRVTQSICLIIPTVKRTHIIALNIDVDNRGVPHELLVV